MEECSRTSWRDKVENKNAEVLSRNGIAVTGAQFYKNTARF